MADFPNSIATPRVVENVDGVTYEAEQTTRLFAEDINNANAEIVAIEQTLGENPQGDYDTVAERLDDMGGGLAFVAVTGDVSPAALDTLYLNNKVGSILQISLPADAPFGARVMALQGTGSHTIRFVPGGGGATISGNNQTNLDTATFGLDWQLNGFISRGGGAWIAIDPARFAWTGGPP